MDRPDTGWAGLGWVGLSALPSLSPLSLSASLPSALSPLALSIPAFRLHSAYWVACTLEPACSIPSLSTLHPAPCTLQPVFKVQSCSLPVSPACSLCDCCVRTRACICSASASAPCRDPTSAVICCCCCRCCGCSCGCGLWLVLGRLLLPAAIHHFHLFLPSCRPGSPGHCDLLTRQRIPITFFPLPSAVLPLPPCCPLPPAPPPPPLPRAPPCQHIFPRAFQNLSLFGATLALPHLGRRFVRSFVRSCLAFIAWPRWWLI